MAVEQMLNGKGGAGRDADVGMLSMRFADERCFRSVLELVLDAIILTTADQQILFYNRAAELMFGYSADEMRGQPIEMLIPPRYRGSYRDDIARLSLGTQSQPSTLRKSLIGLRAGGVEFPCELALSAVSSDQELIYTAIFRDVSGRKRAEDALRKSEALLSESQQIAHIGHWEWTAPGSDLICSPEVFHIFGLPPESLTVPQQVLAAMMHPDDQSRVSKIERAIIAERGHFDYEFRICLPAGGLRWVHQQALVAYADDGQPRHMTGIFQDITERKQVEQELHDRAALLEQVIVLSKNVSAITDLDSCAREILRSITGGLGFDRAGIFLYYADAGLLLGLYGTNRDGQPIDIRGRKLLAAQTPYWRAALRNPHELYVTDDFQGTYNPPADGHMFGVRQHITLVAWSGEAPVAMINVDNLLSQRPVTPSELEALQLFAGYVGLSLANALLHAELEQRMLAQSIDLRAANDALARAARQ